jgi:hypothetical protein
MKVISIVVAVMLAAVCATAYTSSSPSVDAETAYILSK